MVAPLEPELVIERVFQAPRQLVWDAWIDPAQMVKWMGPREYPAVHLEGDVKVGGKWRGCLKSTGSGEDLWQGGEYKKIVEPEKLVFTFFWYGDDGKPENVMLIDLTFTELAADKTKMTLRQTGFRSVEQRDNHHGGWSSTFDRLEEWVSRKS